MSRQRSILTAGCIDRETLFEISPKEIDLFEGVLQEDVAGISVIEERTSVAGHRCNEIFRSVTVRILEQIFTGTAEAGVRDKTANGLVAVSIRRAQNV